MANITANLGGASERGAMRFAHRFFIISAVALLVLAEAIVISSFFGKDKASVDFYIFWLLPVLVVMPLVVASLFYGRMKKSASLSGTNQVDWHLVRFLGTLLMVICYSSMVIIMITLLTAARR